MEIVSQEHSSSEVYKTVKWILYGNCKPRTFLKWSIQYDQMDIIGKLLNKNILQYGQMDIIGKLLYNMVKWIL